MVLDCAAGAAQYEASLLIPPLFWNRSRPSLVFRNLLAEPD